MTGNFPALSREQLSTLRKSLDTAYRDFSRSYGDQIEGFFDPLLQLMIGFEKILIESPWWIILLVLAALIFWVSRSWKIVVTSMAAFIAIGLFGMWENSMHTLSLILFSTLIAITVGIPVGILMATSNRAQRLLTPLLDLMQTMPAFVYLIPVVMLLGIGRIPGLIAVIVYAIPPVIRLTNLGIRLVDREVVEAAMAFGATPTQRLLKVELPLAMPTIMAGINQTIMMALAMVVIASMIGVKGLGQPVLKSITNQYFTLGLLNGLAIVVLAIVFDRTSQAWANRSHLNSSAERH